MLGVNTHTHTGAHAHEGRKMFFFLIVKKMALKENQGSIFVPLCSYEAAAVFKSVAVSILACDK